MHHHPADLATAVEKAVAGVQGVLLATVAFCGEAVLSAERSSEVKGVALVRGGRGTLKGGGGGTIAVSLHRLLVLYCLFCTAALLCRTLGVLLCW